MRPGYFGEMETWLASRRPWPPAEDPPGAEGADDDHRRANNHEDPARTATPPLSACHPTRRLVGWLRRGTRRHSNFGHGAQSVVAVPGMLGSGAQGDIR